MPIANNIHPYGFSDPENYLRFRDRLNECNYGRKKIEDVLGRNLGKAIRKKDIPDLLRRTQGGGPLETLIRLFLLGLEVEISAGRDTLASVSLEDCCDAGLLYKENNKLRGRIILFPRGELILAHDLLPTLNPKTGEDWVMGIGNSTVVLSNLTVRRQITSALDLCSGSGYHGLLAASHSQHVIAADRNPRATAFSQLNSRLNQIDNIESLTGNLWEPVSGRKFDLIVCNPPFVISPSSRFIYRDSGLRGDEFCMRLLCDASAYLNEGGYFHMLSNWAHYSNQDLYDRMRRFFATIGCDVWAIRSKTLDCSNYALTWLKETQGQDSSEHIAQSYEEWMRYYEQEGIEAISDCTLTLRRRENGKNWFQLDDPPEKGIGPVGDSVIQGFNLRDFLEATDNETLLGTKLNVAKEVRLKQSFSLQDSEWKGGPAELYLETGLYYKFQIDPYIGGLISRCNGARTLKELLIDLAEKTNCELSALIPECIDKIRHLIQFGFLIPDEIKKYPKGVNHTSPG